MAISPAGEKVASIQALRAIAATTVAVVHLTSGFAHYIDGRVTLGETGGQLASSSVALFFMISGCVMVLSAGPLFGSARGTLTFWRRRLVRVMPPYWIATLILVAVAWWTGLPYRIADVLGSLVFVPQPHPTGPWSFAVFLWTGWTLLYEMLFYLLFGACVLLGRTGAILAATAVLVFLVIAGQWITLDSLALHAATRPILLLFVPGMALAVMIERGLAIPAWMRWLALVGFVVALVLQQQPAGAAFYNMGYLAYAGIPALLFLVAVMGGPLPFVWPRPILALGDASYAIYLLHVPFAYAWTKAFGMAGIQGGSIAYLALGLPLLTALSLAFYRWVERPMTDWLNRLLGGRRREAEPLARSLAP